MNPTTSPSLSDLKNRSHRAITSGHQDPINEEPLTFIQSRDFAVITPGAVHIRPSTTQIPDWEQVTQVSEFNEFSVTRDRETDIHPTTMYNTTSPGDLGPRQDNGSYMAVALNVDDDDRILPYAKEYEPDARIPLYLNRRFQRYMIGTILIFFLLLLTFILVFVVWRRGSSTSLENDVPTVAPSSLLDRSYFEQFAESLGYQEWNFTVDSPYGRAAKWIMEEDERKLSDTDPGLTQRFLLAVLYFTTTSNGQSPWLSCNPDFTNSSNQKCDFENYIFDALYDVVYKPGPPYRWLSKVHECKWAGNLCDRSNVTRAIDLFNQNITGTLPTELAAFPSIEWISLGSNQFNGTLPTEYASTAMARNLIILQLRDNQLTGTIPKEYYSLTSLQNLEIDTNHLTGTLSSEIGLLTNLEDLHIFSNMISGSIPTEIGKLKYLSFTTQGINMFNGTIPTELGNLLQIQHLWLERNLLTGSIPSELGLLTDMTDLKVNENRLEGTIPSELYSLSKLSSLDLYSNFLSGSINTGIGNLTAITGLKLSRNQLTGTIPTEVGNLPSLGLLWLHSNKLVGSVPTQICEMMNNHKSYVLQTDCFPVGNEPNPCPCCATCCNRDTEICSAVNANDDGT